MKICARCQQQKQKKDFAKGKNSDGLHSYCKQCNKENGTQWRRTHGVAPRKKPRIKSELPESKKCTKCRKIKLKEEFGIKFKQYNDALYCSLNPSCNDCVAIDQRNRYNSKKNDADFKQKNSNRAKYYREVNIEKIKLRRTTPEFLKKHNKTEHKRYIKYRDIICAKNKIRRQTPEYKKMMLDYRNKNKEKIAAQEKVTKRRYHEKHRDNLTDTYIKNQLKSQRIADDDTIKMYPQILEAKRLQLLIIRKTKNNAN